MDKVVRDGMVAVLVSPGFGWGWVSWGNANPFEPMLVEAIEAGADGDMKERIADSLYPDDCNGGARDLVIRWIPQGSHFRITEYDGAETLELRDGTDWMVA